MRGKGGGEGGVKVLQIAFYKFCVRLKSMRAARGWTEKETAKTPGAQCTSASLSLRTKDSLLDQQGQAAGGRERRGAGKAREEHVKWPGVDRRLRGLTALLRDCCVIG